MCEVNHAMIRHDVCRINARFARQQYYKVNTPKTVVFHLHIYQSI